MAIEIAQDGSKVTMENEWNCIRVDLEGRTWSATNKSLGRVIVKNAGFRIDKCGSMVWNDPPCEVSFTQEKRESCFGDGIQIALNVAPQEGYEPARSLMITLYEKRSHIEIGWAVKNQHDFPMRIKNVEVMHDAELFEGQTVSSPQILNCGAGMERNLVKRGWEIDAVNGAMLTYLDRSERQTIVAGGLRNCEYVKSVRTATGKIVWGHGPQPTLDNDGKERMTLTFRDPLGKLVEPQSTYKCPDSFYLDIATPDPFESLEKYGDAIAAANDARPNSYDFPTLCGWMVSTRSLGEGKPINNSPGLVDQAERARDMGLLDYTPLAIRLEPDFYGYSTYGDTQQGWWDDEHWAQYGSLKEPYETFAKYCQKLVEIGIIPFSYFQCNVPSADFAAAHPEWMIGNDISSLHRNYAHNHSHVRYDYTDPGFSEHVLNTWKRLRGEGLRGVKFDYPETAWLKNGGFEDSTFTTSSAYREVFRLCREGLGDDAYIHERILGGRFCDPEVPLTDLTAGIVDLQRVWGDASHFEAEMASRIGLRWYKTRNVFLYYPDGKSFFQNGEALPAYKRRAFLTLIAFLGGRIELGTSFNMMTPEMMFDLTRVYPILKGRVSPRPVDMLLEKEHPEVYLYSVNADWHQVLLVNNSTGENRIIGCPLSGSMIDSGALGLDSEAEYHAFDFWRQKYLGIKEGGETLSVHLRPGEVAMISLRRRKDRPQVISTNRNIMQGLFEVHAVEWNADIFELTGKVDVFKDEPFVLSVACNGMKPLPVSTPGVSTRSNGNDVVDLIFRTDSNETMSFSLTFGSVQL